MNNIIQIIMQTVISILCVIGSLSCINYIFENLIYKKIKREENFFVRDDNSVYLIINVDIIGDKLEYYIRKIQNDIKNKRYIYISKIILYSKNLDYKNCDEESHQKEIARICELLTFDYSNIIFVKGNFQDNVFV
jgi:hypothetical protein